VTLTSEQIRFPQILADGKKKTYVHVVKGFGMPLTPTAPTFTNNLARPLRKAGLVKRAGGGYKITAEGLAALEAAEG
jgi:hypothetical protein